MNRPLKTALDVTVAGLKTVADAGLLPPGFAIVTSVANAVIESCNQVKSHRIANKTIQLHNMFEAQTRALAGTPLNDCVSQVYDVLSSVRDRVSKYASWSFFRCFRHDAYIADELSKCMDDIEVVMERFHSTAAIATVSAIEGPDGIKAKLDKQTEALNRQTEAISQLVRRNESMRDLLTARKEGVDALKLEDKGLSACLTRGMKRLERMQHEMSSSNTSTVVIDNQPVDRIVAINLYSALAEGAAAIQRHLSAGPAIETLDRYVVKHGEIPYSGGTVTDVYQGTYLGTLKVAIKCVRNAEVTDERLLKRVMHEIDVWRHLDHEHILPMLGLCGDLGPFICLISKWQENGNLLDYSRRNPNANRLHLLIGAAKGIEYLHDMKVVHGNLKCSKILVGEKEMALVSDFQMSKLLDSGMLATFSVTIQASARWSAPEYANSIAAHTPGDVYSFAMLMYECFTLQRPFNNVRRDVEVSHYVVNGKRPPRPENSFWISDRMWKLIEECWDRDWTKRPTMKEVVRRLEAIQDVRRQG
ncbi:hypothetical protein NM688_g5653 [Phlebia brevispora]|uniref:Uncharacterized protein n=1 Tax=Phlebia brevispora TaxID=194682 RepID=A0ACC1SS26_9APHY|nr:hypothetical protein NM688_g5653 [Phlebia brevispora]